MTSFFLLALLSIITSYSMAILLVEKVEDYPIVYIVNFLKWVVRVFTPKDSRFMGVFDCTVCMSFWTALFADICICLIALAHGQFYWFWPLSGFCAAGITWTIIQYLNAIDTEGSEFERIIEESTDDE